MNTKLVTRLSLLVALASSLAATSLNAQVSLDFVRFQPETIARTDYDYINIDALVINTGSGVRLGIFNNTTPSGSATAEKPTVTQIYFDASSTFLNATPTFNAGISSAGIDMIFGGSPTNLPGGSQIGFSADSRFSADSPTPKNGINPGEYAYFDFAGSDYNHVVSGLLSADVRFGLHVQQVLLNGSDSVALVSAVPEPSATLLGLLGALALVVCRKR